MNIMNYKPFRRNSFSHDEIELLKKLRGEGKSLPEISSILGRHQGVVSKVVRRYQIPILKTDFWATEDREARLIAMFNEGKSYPDIAAELGCSRNTVGGKAHRLGLSRNSADDRERRKEARAQRARDTAAKRERRRVHKASKPEPAFFPEPDYAEDCNIGNVIASVVALEKHSCRWPMGEPGAANFRFCGHDSHNEKSPYCSWHMAKAYVPWKKVERRRKTGGYSSPILGTRVFA